MPTLHWILLYICQSIIFKWIISWGGARWLEGLKSAVFLGWMTWDWNAEQIRFYILIIWILYSIWFVVGLFFPSLRL
ncbi:hypothetical protein G9F32_09760 [Acinetobacter sp. 194]|uniref:hypothetical protein n=1 Tax=Acinetobacter shaoyimingii TaxID=2715164 RepID=UPI00140C0645|nr:hypothetical protein [Acinetobacter shaoyimingii]NHB58302.1 hypothetical protein [Acinetobacter shaoyimingii]